MKEPKSRAMPNGDELLCDVHLAMESLGWVVPQCEVEVRDAERRLGPAPIPLPEGLRDPHAVFGRKGEGCAVLGPLPASGSPYIEATLERAAREGGRITPEVEEAMRRDREAAEREADRGEEDENQ